MNTKMPSTHDLLFDSQWRHLRFAMLGITLGIFFFFGLFLSMHNADLYMQASFHASRSQYSDIEVKSITHEDDQTVFVVIENHMENSSEILVQWMSIETEDRGFTSIQVPAFESMQISIPAFESMQVIAQEVGKKELHPVNNVRTYFYNEKLDI